MAPTSNVYNPANNRNSYSTYDARGNLTMFGSVALSYDAENRQTAAGSNSYLYDGAGRRVSKTTASGQTTFVYDAFGQLAAEYAGGTVWLKDYIRHAGQVVAIENASGSPCTTCYLSLDLLGGVRMVTDQSANVIARHDYAPFGQEIQSGVGPRTSLWGAGDNVNQKFTGQERDGETNLDFFQARYLSSGIGRFNSPDPGNAGADFANPQSWKGYAYVLNNPVTMTDPSGLDPFSPGDPGDPGDGCDDDDRCGGFPWPTGPGGPVTPPPPPPRQTESGGGNTLPRGSFPGGETLGLPPGTSLPGPLGIGSPNPFIFDYNSAYHIGITMQGGGSAWLAFLVTLVDFWRGSQGTGASNTAWHSMAGGLGGRDAVGLYVGEYQSCAEAYASAQRYVAYATARGDTAAALHAIQDSYSSSHAYQPWDGSLTLGHEQGDFSLSNVQSAVDATSQYLKAANGAVPMRPPSAYLAPLGSCR